MIRVGGAGWRVSDPRVAVILTVYNASEYLRGAIQSVFDQTYSDWQLLILDDGSSDPLVPLICDEASYDHRVRVERFDTTVGQRRKSCRYAALVNYGVANSESEYVTFLAGDDAYYPDRFERMVGRLDEGHDVVYGAQDMFGEDGRLRGVRPAGRVLSDAFHLVDYNSVMVSRVAFDRVGGFPTGKGLWRDADGWLWRRLTDAGYRFVPVDGGSTDRKTYREQSVDARVIRGESPWS